MYVCTLEADVRQVAKTTNFESGKSTSHICTYKAKVSHAHILDINNLFCL